METDPPMHLAGKSTAYDYLKSAPDEAWAWEFVRRSPQVRRAIADTHDHRDPPQCDGVNVVHVMSSDTDAPIRWASSADDDSAHATVAWNDQLTRRALKAVAVPVRFACGGTILDLEAIALEKTLLVAQNGDQTLIVRDRQRSLQIEIAGSPLTDPVALFIDTKVSKKRAARQLRLLDCFLALRTTGELPDRCFPPHPRSARNAFVLEALDGHLAGKHHRDIAVGLFGEARVDRDWSDPGENMRDVVRRAVARGLATMERGFLNFFR